MKAMRHNKFCRCLQCKYKAELAGLTDYSATKYLSDILKKAIIKQLKFNKRSRGKLLYKPYLSKLYKNDEWLTVKEYTFHLINCRKCEKITKAFLYNKFKCINCNANSDYYNHCEWSSWGRTA